MLLFWPRGATAALGRALSAAFVTNSGYLADAVDRLTMTTKDIDTEPGQRASHSAYLLLDDAFRQYFAERGAKVVSVETVSQLFTGANRIRLAAFTLARLPAGPAGPGPARNGVGGHRRSGAPGLLRRSHRWYEEFAEMLATPGASSTYRPKHDASAARGAARRLRGRPPERRLDRLQATLQMRWADQLLESEPGAGRSGGLGRTLRQAAGDAGLTAGRRPGHAR